MFCSCLNDPSPFEDSIFFNKTDKSVLQSSKGEGPNVNICPVCLAHPGSLPVINKAAIQAIAKLGLALNGRIDDYSQFDRKSYFYPDLPKGYQISQYEHPIVKGGSLKGVRITRIHMEEDTGRLLHETQPSTLNPQPYSLVDFNRAGVPLIELVTEPDIKNSEQAVAFAKELQLILRYLKISDADMEKGQMRVEANISLREIADQRRLNTQINADNLRESASHQRESASTLGTKVEVKNLNSFKAVHDAIEYEIKRQTEVLKDSRKVIQETRGWDDGKNVTQSQRTKESAHDYRYFPEPDLPPLNMSQFNLANLKAELPELPEEKRNRFKQEFKIPEEQIEILVNDRAKAEYFEEAATELKLELQTTHYSLLTNYFISDLQGLMGEYKTDIKDLKISPHEFAHFISLIDRGELSSKLAKELLGVMFTTGEDPETIRREKGLQVLGDVSALGDIIEKVIASSSEAVADYKKGKSNALQFLVGKVMAETKGKADPQVTKKILVEKLDKWK